MRAERPFMIDPLLAFSLVLALQGPHVLTDRPGARLLPLPKEEGVFHFVVFGDRTGGPKEGIRVLEQAVADANLLGPDLVMTVGDLVEGYNAAAAWTAQAREYSAVMDRLAMPWYPVAGNHDIYWRGPDAPPGEHERDFETQFGPLWYWFRHKNAAFVALYSDEGDLASGEKGFSKAQHTQMSERQLAWLRATLAETKSLDHVFLFLHHPRWQSERYPGTNWDAVHSVLVEAGNVSAVFAGHIHRMSYGGKRDGIEYFTLATVGAALDSDFPRAGWLHHLNVVTVRASGITVAAVPVGAVIDPREMTEERLAELQRLRSIEPKRLSPVLGIERDGSAAGSVVVEIANPTSRPIEVTASAAGDGWASAPNHRHVRIPAREAAPIALELGRLPSPEGAGFEEPVLELAIEWIGETMRVAAPTVRRPIEMALRETPDAEPPPAEEHALQLPGRSACVRVSSADLDLPDGPFTLEGWIRGRSYAGRRGFLNKTENAEFGLFVTDGIPAFLVHLDGKYASALAPQPVLEPGRWHHLAGVFDGSEVRLYLDGRRIASSPGKGRRTTNGLPLLVGADVTRSGNAVDGHDGEIDDVRVSLGTRYGGETFVPSRRHVSDASTRLLLHFDRALGPFVVDDSPRRRHPRLSSGAVVLRAGS